MQNNFESHLLSVKPLPFIFHLDKVYKNYSVGNNWHTNTEFLYFIDGEGTVSCANENIEAEKGDIVIINSNVYHSVSSETEVKYYCLIPDSSFCRYNGIDTENLKFVNKIKDDKASLLFDTVVSEFNTDTTEYREGAIKSSFLSLLIYIARNYSESVSENRYTGGKGEGIKHALGYIHSHITTRLTIDELSNESGLSKYYFLREFKKMTGDSPIVFINKLRCENAKKMLLNGAYSVQETADKCGFESVSYFCKTFKNYTGKTPGKYAKS